MDSINFYWPTYKNIEDEIENLSKYITFCNEQKTCFSNYIADLILKCAAEIESISKELYFKLGGPHQYSKNGSEKKLKFDYDCLEFLEKKLKLSKKKIMLSNRNFHFERKEIYPFKKENKIDKYIWNDAYQSLKHNKSTNIQKASIENLIFISSALFILNIYYNNKEFSNIGVINNVEFDSRCGSKLFNVNYNICYPVNRSGNINTDLQLKSNIYEDCIYLIRYSNKNYIYQFNEIKKIQNERDQKLLPDFIQYAQENDINISDYNFDKYVLKIGYWKFKKQFDKLETINNKIKALMLTPEYINFDEKPDLLNKSNFDTYVFKIGSSSFFDKNFNIYSQKIYQIEKGTKLSAILNI